MKAIKILDGFTSIVDRARAVMGSCKTLQQAKVTHDWALGLLDNRMKRYEESRHSNKWCVAFCAHLAAANKIKSMYMARVMIEYVAPEVLEEAISEHWGLSPELIA